VYVHFVYQGGKIHATIRKQLLYMFQSKIEEGEVYEMSYFSVFPERGYYRTTLHPFKLIFQMKTKVKLSQSADISYHGLSLTDISEVCAHTHDYEFLVGWYLYFLVDLSVSCNIIYLIMMFFVYLFIDIS
jgi:hypothetical protein